MVGHLVVGDAAMPLLDGDPQLQPCQVCSWAAVRPSTEGKMRVGKPIKPELVRNWILVGVASGRCGRQHYPVAGLHRTAGELSVPRHDPDGRRNREQPQDLLDSVGDALRLGSQQPP